MARTASIRSENEDHDGCVCGIDIAAGEATADIDLPPATGGVETAPGPAERPPTDAEDAP